MAHAARKTAETMRYLGQWRRSRNSAAKSTATGAAIANSRIEKAKKPAATAPTTHSSPECRCGRYSACNPSHRVTDAAATAGTSVRKVVVLAAKPGASRRVSTDIAAAHGFRTWRPMAY